MALLFSLLQTLNWDPIKSQGECLESRIPRKRVGINLPPDAERFLRNVGLLYFPGLGAITTSGSFWQHVVMPLRS